MDHCSKGSRWTRFNPEKAKPLRHNHGQCTQLHLAPIHFNGLCSAAVLSSECDGRFDFGREAKHHGCRMCTALSGCMSLIRWVVKLQLICLLLLPPPVTVVTLSGASPTGFYSLAGTTAVFYSLCAGSTR